MRVDLRRFHRALCQVKTLVPKSKLASLRRFMTFAVEAGTVKRRRRFFRSFDVAKRLAGTGLAKSRYEIRQFYRLLSLVGTVGYIEELEMLKAIRLAGSVTPRTIRDKRIPTGADFQKVTKLLEEKGDRTEKLMLMVMLASGRRQIDVTRLAHSFP